MNAWRNGMTYLLENRDGIPSQLLRVFTEQIQEARTSLANYPHPDPEGLHSARKNIKRLRSLLRLLGDRESGPAKGEIGDCLRHVGRSLSLHRDREVVAAVLQAWRDEAAQSALAAACDQLRQIVVNENGNRDKGLDEDVRRAALGQLEAIAILFGQSGLPETNATTLCQRSEKTVEKLRAAGSDYLEFPNIHRLHEWRKRSKDRMYQQQLLLNLCPKAASGMDSVKAVETLLGMARDCDLVHATVLECREKGLPVEAADMLSGHAAARKEGLLEQARSHWEAIRS